MTPLFAALVSVVVALPSPAARAADAVPTTRTAKTCIALAGDSTVTDDAGWGKGFALALSDKDVQCANFSRGGRSSGSFIKEGRWQRVLELKPDVVLIQFGHNDQPGHGPDRESDPQTTYKANLARYVDDARAAGIKPVLLTPLSRRQWGDDNHIHSGLQPYADAARQLAAEKNVPLIDLHDWSIGFYESLGAEGCKLISPPKAGGYDGTHLNLAGAESVGPYVAVELRLLLPEIARSIRGYIPADRKSPTTRAASAAPVVLPTRPSTPPTARGARTITVAADGTGDFRTVQEAVAAAPDNNADRTTIRIRPGVYHGQVVVPASKPNLMFEGDSPESTILTYALNVSDPVPPGVPERMNGNGVCVLADDFRAANLTFRNTSGDHGQAMALRCEGDRAVFTHCRLLGWQDTLLVSKNRQYFKDCYIEGRVDFIYGGSTAVFDRCHIHTKNGGYITAASTPQDQPFGYAFLDCKVTGEGAPAELGRPWRPYAAVAFLRCDLGPNIKPTGWNNWGKADNEKTARYAEYKCTGPGAALETRVPWAKQLTDADAAKYTVPNILAGADGWRPPS
jgi:pectinesterase